jgi:hypothetical protein
MKKLLLILALPFVLAGCAVNQTGHSNVDKKMFKSIGGDEYSAEIFLQVYEITDPTFKALKSTEKDDFIDNVTSHLTEVPLETALSKVKYKIKDKNKFFLQDGVPKAIGKTDVNISVKNDGMMVVAQTNNGMITLNIFNRIIMGVNGYTNSLSEITMPLTDENNLNRIAYRISEYEIILIEATKH